VSDAVSPVVINQTMATRYWPGRSAVGKPLAIGSAPARVAGVVRDSVYYSLGDHGIAFLYLPADRDPRQAMTVIARTVSDVLPTLPSIEHAVSAVDRRVAVSAPASFENVRDVPLYSPRAFASTAGLFSALALILTSIGLYGVTAASVGQRTMEIGLRMALGARASDVVGGLLWDAARVVAAGVAVGLAGGYAIAGALGSWLFGIGRFDALTYAMVVGLVSAIALAAAWWPARRAARIDPVRALRAG
jgi:putative ABC transport system permease protein